MSANNGREAAAAIAGDVAGTAIATAATKAAAAKVAGVMVAKQSAALLAAKTAGTGFAHFGAAKVAAMAGLKAGAVATALGGPVGAAIAPVVVGGAMAYAAVQVVRALSKKNS
jgi:hypothetical protein